MPVRAPAAAPAAALLDDSDASDGSDELLNADLAAPFGFSPDPGEGPS